MSKRFKSYILYIIQNIMKDYCFIINRKKAKLCISVMEINKKLE